MRHAAQYILSHSNMITSRVCVAVARRSDPMSPTTTYCSTLQMRCAIRLAARSDTPCISCPVITQTENLSILLFLATAQAAPNWHKPRVGQ